MFFKQLSLNIVILINIINRGRIRIRVRVISNSLKIKLNEKLKFLSKKYKKLRFLKRLKRSRKWVHTFFKHKYSFEKLIVKLSR